MPTAPTAPPVAPVTAPASGAPVKAPAKLPAFLVGFVADTALSYAPTLGASATKGIDKLFAKLEESPLTATEIVTVTAMSVAVVTRSVSILRRKLS